MSIKIYDNETADWKKIGTPHALNVEVEDMGGKFSCETKNVENCLSEIKDDLGEMKKNIDYIYENGTLGSGGGGGGSVIPTITLKGENQYVVKPDETIDIRFYFSSPNPGNGKAVCTNGDEVTEMTVTKGVEYKWVVGPFKRGTYTLSIIAEDRQGIYSDPVLIGVKSGALAIETTFDDSEEFAPTDNVRIPYNIISDVDEPVTVDLKLNDNPIETIHGNIGTNIWEIGRLPLMGTNKASMIARNSKYESNKVNFTLVAADSETLTISTTFETEVVSYGKSTIIPYRISKLGEFSFYVDYIIDDQLITTIETRNRVNYWDATAHLELGEHVLQIVARTTDGLHTAGLEIPLTVVATDFTPEHEVTSGLIAKFDAKGKLNGSSNQAIWEDSSGNNVSCTLHNFNFATNGWIKDEETGNTELKFSGKTYAKIHLPIFQNDIGKEGFTFDILYKTKNIGDKDAKILQCRNILSPYQGIEIDTEQAVFSNRNSQAVYSLFAEDIWTRQTFVVDRTQNKVFVYTNAINSGYNVLTSGVTSDYKFAGDILLGAGYGSMAANGEGSNPTNFANGSIRKIRIYNRTLSATEILKNHISDMSFEEQEKVLALNEENEIGAPVGMPYVNIKGLMEGIETNGAERDGEVEYWDPFDASKSMTQQCKFSIQGTSSKEYKIKNYTIKLFEGSTPYAKWSPKDEWLPEPRWTIKANYMDSSQANNIGTNKFIDDFNNKQNRTYPSQITNAKCRSNVDGFPIALLINGKFEGVYTFNIDRYAPHNYGFVTSYNENGTANRHPTAVSYEIAANSTNGAGAFLDDSWDSIKTEFKHRYNWRGEEAQVTTTELGQTVLAEGQHTELQELITWVKNADDDEFYKELKDHFSVDHLIDYFLIAYVLGMADKLKLSAVNLL